MPYSRSGKSSTQIAWLGLGFTRVRGRLRLRLRVHSPRLSRAAPTARVATSQPCVHAAEPPPPPSHPAAQGGRCAVLSSRARREALRPLLSRLRCLADVEDDLTGLVTARQRTVLVVVRGRHGRWPGRCSAASGGLCNRGGCCRACCRRFPLGLSLEPPRRRSLPAWPQRLALGCCRCLSFAHNPFGAVAALSSTRPIRKGSPHALARLEQTDRQTDSQRHVWV